MALFTNTPERSVLPEGWGVRLFTRGPLHALAGRSSLVTHCGVDLTAKNRTYECMPVTCQHCLEVLGCLPPEV